VIDKEHAHTRKGIFMVDASKGFMKDGNKNRLRAQDIHKIVDVFTHQRELPRYSRMVPLSEIAANDYNLNIPRYIDSSEAEDLHDLSAHLQGGIPNRDIDALAAYWRVFPGLRATLFEPQREGYSRARVKAGEVKTTILNHPEFRTFAAQSLQPFTAWCERAALDQIRPGDSPKQLIGQIGEDLLEHYAAVPLLDRYDIYQILMDYWAETMQDDVYMLVQEGWQAARQLRELVAKKGEKLKEQPDLVIAKTKYKADLIPPQLIVARFFADEQAQIDRLQSELDSATQELDSYLEENSSDDGLLSDALNDKDKVTKATVTARLKLATDPDEIAALKQAKKLFDAEARAKKALKEAQEALDLAVFKQYPQLSEAEIKTLIVEDKWLATLKARIEAEIERITQQLANRVRELEERYSEPLPTIEQSVSALSDKVYAHLAAMGMQRLSGELKVESGK
jgi:type I restriction enzyme M protein